MSDANITYNAAPILSVITATLTKQIGKKTFSASVRDLCDKSIAYLMEYGYTQSMGDTKALSVLEKCKQAEKANVLPEGFSKELDTATAAKALAAFFQEHPESKPLFEAWENAFIEERANSRFDAILAGEMVFGSSEV